MKITVNSHWLPEGAENFEKSVLGGTLPALPKRIEPDMALFLEEKAAQVAGRPARILELGENLPLNSSLETPLWNERAFLRGFAFSRLGREVEADSFFSQLPHSYFASIQVEKALLRLNRGELGPAESLFVAAAKQGEFDPFTACTLLGGLSLARINQGDFLGAEQALRERRRILRVHPSVVLEFGTRLYELLLRLERNDFEGAAFMLDQALGEARGASVNQFFLLHLRLRLQLARNDLAAAAASLKELAQLRADLGFPEGVLDFRLEEIEWHLRSGRAADAQKALNSLAEAAPPSDQFLDFRLSLLRAQAFFLVGEKDAAFEEIQEAIAKGETKRYRPGLSWAFLHAAGIALAAGHPLGAKLFLNRGRQISSELRLDVRLAGFSYLSDVLEQRFANSSALLSLARNQKIGPELEYFLDAYGLLSEARLMVSTPEGKELVAERRLRRQLFGAPGAFWFQRESVLVANLGKGKVEQMEFTPASPITSFFRLLWAERQAGQPGLTLVEVHRLRSSAAYKEHLHSGAAKMLISRLRQQIAKSGLVIAYDRASGRYSLQSEMATFTIQSESDSGKPARDRKAEVLARISMEPFVATRALCEEFGVSRQALHPWLQQLVQEDRIKLVRRGPISGYIFRR
jgi:tetratricopeptide (TPR) repeat protein